MRTFPKITGIGCGRMSGEASYVLNIWKQYNYCKPNIFINPQTLVCQLYNKSEFVGVISIFQ